MKQSLLDRYIELHPNFKMDLETLSSENRIKFERKLKKESQKDNFLSTISEFRFCQFLEKESFEYEFEPKFGSKRPDFLFKTHKDETVYFDVKRFNVSDFDKRNQRMLYELCTRLKTIKKPYYLHVDQLAIELNFDINKAFIEIEKWILNNDLNEGDYYTYQDELKIEIEKTDGIKDHVLYMYSSENPKIHVNKPMTDIISKISSYQDSIIKNGFPFFVAIDLTYDTLKDPSDYWLQFLGGSCMDITSWSESFRLGAFYNNSLLNSLVGLLIRYNNQFYWLNNPRNQVELRFEHVKNNYE